MSGYYDNTNSNYDHLDLQHEGLQEIPEDVDFLHSSFSAGIEDIESQGLASENVVRWIEQGEENHATLEQRPPVKAKRRPPPSADHEIGRAHV